MMTQEAPQIHTLGALKASGYQPKSIQEELRSNLIEHLKAGKTAFAGIWGYEQTVIPQVERAILAQHHINLLGLRGQAKTRIARSMVGLLDPWMPIIAGSEVNDDPLQPISHFGKNSVAELGDNTPILWVSREDRFFEKLATPDVTVADLIGDVDPIKAASRKLTYADPEIIHFGMVPRAHRCIFVINELPDLQARIQVALFNALQEGDIQIRGFRMRLPIDIQFVFTANPEDYTNRGSIVTPLKDRIGSQILTHYPETIEIAQKITAQEVHLTPEQEKNVHVPELARQLVEEISFAARESAYVDEKSGISARLSISALENLISGAERRSLVTDSGPTTIRLSDFLSVVPAITGKIELLYEGEQEGADRIAQLLIDEAVKRVFKEVFPKVDKVTSKDGSGPYDPLLLWFVDHEGVDIHQDADDTTYQELLDSIKPLDALIDKYASAYPQDARYILKEIVLWGLVSAKKLSRTQIGPNTSFQDPYGAYFKKI